MQSIKTVEQLNKAVRTHKRKHKLTETERAVLDLLARYSCKEPGKSWLAKSTIAEKVGKSRRQVIRVCNKLEKLGIIKQYPRKRTTGDRRQTSNLIVILPASDDDNESQKTNDTPRSHTKESGKRNSNKNNINTIATEEMQNGALKRSIPAELFNALKPYFNDRDMYKAVGTLWRAKASIDRNITFEQHSSVYVDAFKNVIFHYKRGKVRNLFAYLYSTWRQVTTEIKRRLTQAESDLFYDWLNA